MRSQPYEPYPPAYSPGYRGGAQGYTADYLRWQQSQQGLPA